MNKDFPYTFSKKKTRCPKCQKPGVFAPLVWKDSGFSIGREFGMCDRNNNCGYKCFPTKDITRNHYQKDGSTYTPIAEITEPEGKIYISDIYPQWVGRSVKALFEQNVERCPFLWWLMELMRCNVLKYSGADAEQRCLKLAFILQTYCVGIAPDNTSILFWYIDENGNASDCKHIKYKTDGHRDKNAPFGEISYYGVLFKDSKLRKHYQNGMYGFALRENVFCTPQNKPSIPYFGTHVTTKYPDSIIAIVESEKTAILGAILYSLDKVVWIATRGKANFNTYHPDWLNCLYNRDVIVYADRDAETEWCAKLDEVWGMSGARTMELIPMEKVCNEFGVALDEKPDNYDLGDLFVDFLKRKRV